jgi:glycerol uptake facilitator-like aquaporin
VAAYIGAAYWFTASTSFANPAAVFGRMMSNSFAGIAPENALGFVLAEISGLAVVAVVYKGFHWRQ